MDRLAPRSLSLPGLLIASALLCTGPAHAAPGCSGLQNGTSLQPLPKPLTLALGAQPADAVNPDLAQAFVKGMTASGVTIVGPGQGNANINLTFSIGRPNSGVNSYNNLAWVSGEPIPGSKEWSLTGAILQASAEVTDASNYGLSWTGTFQCVIDGKDPSQLAGTIGKVIGAAIGKNLERSRF